GADLVPARLIPGDIHVDALEMDDRGDGIEESELVLAGGGADALGQAGRGERAGGDDDKAGFGQRIDALANDLDVRMRCERRRDAIGEAVTIDGERGACRYLMLVR